MTLSACETALGQEVNGEGILGISRALLYAGAKSVISSLWLVDDQATALLMEVLYADLAPQGTIDSGRDPISALEDAKRVLAHGWPASSQPRPGMPEPRHPYYWAGFIFYGVP